MRYAPEINCKIASALVTLALRKNIYIFNFTHHIYGKLTVTIPFVIELSMHLLVYKYFKYFTKFNSFFIIIFIFIINFLCTYYIMFLNVTSTYNIE